MPQNGAERPFSPICVHSLSPRLSTTAHLTERRTLHSPLDRGETKKRILLQRLTKNRSLVSPGIASKIVVYERREKKTIACPRMSVRPRND